MMLKYVAFMPEVSLQPARGTRSRRQLDRLMRPVLTTQKIHLHSCC